MSDEPAAVRLDAGGRELAAWSLGEGTPAIILETGFGAPASSWLPVAQPLAREHRVAWYERAGRGDSPRASGARTPDDLLADLRLVVQRFGGGAPCVLVGQSFGGLLVRLYAARHPSDVVGLVLVDSLHQDQFDQCGPLLPPPFEGEPAQLTGMRSFWQGGWRDPARNDEGIDMVACCAAAAQVGSFGDLPIRILTASTWTYPPRMPPAAGERLQRVWDGLQQELMSLGTRARRELLAECGHFVQVDRPQAVVEAVESVLAEIAS